MEWNIDASFSKWGIAWWNIKRIQIKSFFFVLEISNILLELIRFSFYFFIWFYWKIEESCTLQNLHNFDANITIYRVNQRFYCTQSMVWLILPFLMNLNFTFSMNENEMDENTQLLIPLHEFFAFFFSVDSIEFQRRVGKKWNFRLAYRFGCMQYISCMKCSYVRKKKLKIEITNTHTRAYSWVPNILRNPKRIHAHMFTKWKFFVCSSGMCFKDVCVNLKWFLIFSAVLH